MKRVAMLKHFGVIPVMVFDGAPLPSKLAKEHERLASREENKAKGMELLRDGHRARAMDHFQKCIDITPELAYQLIEVQCAVTRSALFPDKPIQRDAHSAVSRKQHLLPCNQHPRRPHHNQLPHHTPNFS